MKKIILIACILIIGIGMHAQAFKWAATWNSSGTQKDLGSAVTTDASGNVYVTGGANYPFGSNRSIEIIKYNSSGTQQWATSVDVNASSGCDMEYGYAIAVDGNGYVWVSAVTYSGATNNDDFTLIRLNNSGTVQANYPKRYNLTSGCTGGDLEQATALYVYNTSSVYIGGAVYTGSVWQYIVLKDDVGNSGWSWSYTKTGTSAGSGKQHRVTDIKADANYVYATGWIQNTSQGKDVWTVKLDASTGSASWGTQYDNSANAYDQVALALVVDGSGNVYVAGYQGTASNGNDALLLKYNSSGTLQSGFPATYNGSGNSNDAWMDISNGPSGSSLAVFVGGYANRTSTGNDYALAAYTSSGGFYSSWSTNPVFYDGAGSTEAPNTDMGKAIEYSASSSRVYISGVATENSPNTNDPNITIKGYSVSNGSNVFSVSYDYGSTDPQNIDEVAWKYSMQVKWNATFCVDEIYLQGDSYTAGNGYDYLTLKYGPNGNPCGRLAAVPQVTTVVVPNPFGQTAQLTLPYAPVDAYMQIFDVAGNLVSAQYGINSEQVLIERGDMPAGIYFYRVIENEAIVAQGKFVTID